MCPIRQASEESTQGKGRTHPHHLRTSNVQTLVANRHVTYSIRANQAQIIVAGLRPHKGKNFIVTHRRFAEKVKVVRTFIVHDEFRSMYTFDCFVALLWAVYLTPIASLPSLAKNAFSKNWSFFFSSFNCKFAAFGLFIVGAHGDRFWLQVRKIHLILAIRAFAVVVFNVNVSNAGIRSPSTWKDRRVCLRQRLFLVITTA